VTVEDVLAELAERIRSERSRAGWTQEDLAYAAGMSVRQVAALERGAADPKTSTLVAIASAFKVPLASMLSADVPRAPKKVR
jgi:XRE family transcriptional regulator, fatty acid utilization regulator